MGKIQVGDKHFIPFITAQLIRQEVDRIALEISRDLAGTRPVFISVLNGAFVFTADLVRRLRFDCQISFIKLASYSGSTSTGQVTELVGLNEDLTGRQVVVVEDIIDTGITMGKIIDILRGKGASEVRIAALLFKPDAFMGHFRIDYLGFSIPNEFIVGYGLDYNGLGRNLPDIYQITDES
ncbi:MAG: hypoxanthine phosphoribosyltransferase [Bacteroidales bacterium]|nr:hypoxanthine phosphoribosyltransferase [Bacteroidales bacterium]